MKRKFIIFAISLSSALTLISCEKSNLTNNRIEIGSDINITESEIESEVEPETIATESEIESSEVVKEYTEDEYKAMCQEMFYDEVFFGNDNLEGAYVKLHLFLSEKYYFDNDVIYSDTYKEYFEKYHMNKDFYKCCVLREGSDSYVGNQINMWFSEDFDLNPDNYETGQKIVVYAEVISWSNNTWNGYNSVTIIPKYIEVK